MLEKTKPRAKIFRGVFVLYFASNLVISAAWNGVQGAREYNVFFGLRFCATQVEEEESVWTFGITAEQHVVGGQGKKGFRCQQTRPGGQ